ncbi:MAG TPA: hypothetical protein VMP08_11050, partial [Anaerolineae bacterium]|nr:hypothetical protein [Anaerolineae bacterium]
MRSKILILGLIILLALTVSASVLAASPQAPTATCIWNGTTGNWSDTTKWTGCGSGSPSTNDTAVISGGTVTIDQDVTVQGLTISGGTLQGSNTLTVTQAMAWSGCAALGGSGATTIGSSATLTVTWGGGSWACPSMNGRTLNILGGAVLTASDGHYVYLQGGSLINNAGLFDLQDGAALYSSGGDVVNNAGLLRKVGGTGTSSLNGVALNNTGTVQVLTGTLNLAGGGTSSGSFNAASGATLNFGGGTHVITLALASSINGAGTVGVSGGTVTIGGSGAYATGGTAISGGTLNLNRDGTTGNFNFNGGTLAGSNTLTVTQAMAWSGCAALGGSGATTIGSSATLTVTWGGGSWACPSVTGRTLNILGAAVLTASDGHYVYLQGGSVISNSGTLDFQDRATLYSSGGDVVNNAGLLRKVGGAGTGTLDGVALNNTGSVQVLTGTLNAAGGGTSSGNFNTMIGATLNFGGGTHMITLAPASSINGAGTFGVSGGTVTIGGGSSYATGGTAISGGTFNLNRDGTTGNLNLSGGTLQGSNTLTVTQAMAWSGCAALGGSGATTIGSSATLTVTWGGGSWACPSMNGRTLNILGGAVLTASDGHYVYLQGGSLINNAGLFDLQDNAKLYANSGGGSMNNAGLMRKVGGSGTSTLDTVSLNNTGTVQVLTGTLSLSSFTQNSGVTMLNGGSLAGSSAPLNFYGGTLQGAGTIYGNVANIGGTASPGMSPGVLHIAGNYTQGPTGTLNIELGGVISGTQHDLLDVTGATSLSGTLNVSLINSFTPISGTVFRIVNFSTRSGDFITETGLNVGGWLSLLPYYSP